VPRSMGEVMIFRYNGIPCRMGSTGCRNSNAQGSDISFLRILLHFESSDDLLEDVDNEEEPVLVLDTGALCILLEEGGFSLTVDELDGRAGDTTRPPKGTVDGTYAGTGGCFGVDDFF